MNHNDELHAASLESEAAREALAAMRELEADGHIFRVEAWKARGGYGSQSDGRGRENAARERIWFSPGCLKAPSLFS